MSAIFFTSISEYGSGAKFQLIPERSFAFDNRFCSDRLNGLANAIYPNRELSDQAINILRQFVKSSSSEFIKHKSRGRTDILIPMNGEGKIEFDEWRFVDDDLNKLVEYGLLRFRYGRKGSEVYGITRNAVDLINEIDK